jgi:hypothetical protein
MKKREKKKNKMVFGFTFANTVSDGRKLVNERKSRRRKNCRKDGPIAIFWIA